MVIGVHICANTLEVNMVVFQKTGNSSTPRSNCRIPGHVPKRCPSEPQGLFLNYAQGNFICNSQKQPRCPSTEEWIKKMWFIYTMEYYSAMKNKGIMKFAGQWMELENIILSEVTQTQKDKHGMCSLISGC